MDALPMFLHWLTANFYLAQLPPPIRPAECPFSVLPGNTAFLCPALSQVMSIDLFCVYLPIIHQLLEDRDHISFTFVSP